MKKGKKKEDLGNYQPGSLPPHPVKSWNVLLEDTSKHVEDRELLRDRKSRSCPTNLAAFPSEMIASVYRGKARDVINLNFLQSWNRLSREAADTHHWNCLKSSCPGL